MRPLRRAPSAGIRLLARIAWATAFGFLLGGTPAQAADRGAAIAFSPCRLAHPSHLTSVEAECGSLAVPEDPREPRGRQVQLFVARVPAISRRKAPDPLFVLAGGPGMGATTFYPTVAAAFARIQRDRDIILVDQRGTGRSNALNCAMEESELWRASADALVGAARTCLSSLTAHADVAFYTTSLAVQDLDRVRAALGYPVINLYGVSYGTRVAQHYLRRFPMRTRSLVLDGAVPAPAALGASSALDAEAALGRIFARCRAEAACRQAFPDPALAYHALRDALAQHPVAVSVADPATGNPTQVTFGDEHLASVLRLSSYTSEQAALLPLSLDRAQRGDFAPLASQFLLVNRTYEEVLAFGMHNTVVCTEDVPFYPSAGIDRARVAQTYLGTAQLDGLEKLCALWPRGPMDADFHEPLHSDRPVLLLTGEDDPVTPPAFTAQVARGLEHSLVVEFRGTGHGQLSAPCADALMARFIERGSTAGLDVSCARRAVPFPFFISLAGPPP